LRIDWDFGFAYMTSDYLEDLIWFSPSTAQLSLCMDAFGMHTHVGGEGYQSRTRSFGKISAKRISTETGLL
jgi:hypothetical protein